MNKTLGLMGVLWCCAQALAGNNSPALSEQLSASLFSQLIGDWQITDQSLDQQGQWQPGPGASWVFYPVLNGHAIQDDWISPPTDQPAPDSGRQYGTNIRIYNPREQRWEMAWMSVKGQQVDTFYATEDERHIIMTGQFNGRSSRITLYEITAVSFQWKLEFHDEADDSWLEVYRIQGQRSVKAP
jgi:hypothetical protein